MAGMAGRGEVEICKEVQHLPPRVDFLSLSSTPRQATLETGDILVLAHGVGAAGQRGLVW